MLVSPLVVAGTTLGMSLYMAYGCQRVDIRIAADRRDSTGSCLAAVECAPALGMGDVDNDSFGIHDPFIVVLGICNVFSILICGSCLMCMDEYHEFCILAS